MAATGEMSGAGLPWPEVAAGDPAPLYGVFGEEDFMVSQAVEAFLASPVFADNPSLNVERFLAGEAPPARVLESASTLPFLGRRRLVVVGDAHLYKAEQAAQFLAYFEDPAPTACLVLAGGKVDQRTRFYKSLAARGKVHIFKKLYARELLPWLAGRARLRGKRLAPAAAQELAELAGLGLGALDSELEKLSLFVGRRAEITSEDVKGVVGASRLYSIFDLTDAVAARRLERALTAYHQLDSLGEPAVRVVAMLMRLFRQLLEAREVVEAGGGEAEVQRRLRTPTQASRTLHQRARSAGAANLTRPLKLLLEADQALKSRPGADRVIVERLLMDLCV